MLTTTFRQSREIIGEWRLTLSASRGEAPAATQLDQSPQSLVKAIPDGSIRNDRTLRHPSRS